MTTMEPAADTLGLSSAEAAARLRHDGPNRLAQGPQRGLRAMVLGVVMQPMFMLLLATALVYAIVGSIADAAVLLVSVAAVAAISLVQEYRSERVLDSLKELSSPRSRVVRDGQVVLVPSQALVKGDRLLVSEGDRMACDATLTVCHGLSVDESLLSGESAPVLKSASQRVQAGTLIVSGDGVALVDATGAGTALGQIGGALRDIDRRPSRVQAELRRVVARVGLFALAASAAAALLYAAQRGSWVEGLLVGLTLAMAIIPEEFAVVWTVMLALGAWRLARLGVLTRQAQAIEALGTTTVLCVDKTGTLTHNRMELVALTTPEQTTSVSATSDADEGFRTLLDAAAWASVENGIEPMDQAVMRLARRWFGSNPRPGTLLIREGVAPERPWFSNLWQRADGRGSVLAIKGAPEAVLALCEIEQRLRVRVAADAERLARQGLRVLGVAQAESLDDTGKVRTMPRPRWIGLLAFLDPVRDDVPAAMAQCRQAGMRVVMITGDSPATATAIARMARLAPGSAPMVVQGTQLAAMADSELDRAVLVTSIFARVSPAQKLRIVRALQRHGEVVAMTGDGVNDAPALRAADIGVAMGRRGTDVAREAAALVLLEDSFAALVGAVRMGRRIFANLHNAVAYLIAVHVPIVGVSLLPVLLGGPVLLLPLHVVLLELIIDPACSLVFEAEAEPADAMQQPPRPASVRLLAPAAAGRALGIGALALALTGATLAACHYAALDADWMRLATLVSLIAGNLLMLVWYRRGEHLRGARRSNRAFQWLMAGVLAALAGIAVSSRFIPQFGLPSHPVVPQSGLLLAAMALGAAWLLWHRARSAPESGAGPGTGLQETS
ncbi:MAG TPA: HAD-IC family P-type ATPase [Rubrivivax sp.]